MPHALINITLMVMEVQQENYLHSLVEEMLRWKGILQQEFQSYVAKKRSQRSFDPS